jgi:hypothetical protein
VDRNDFREGERLWLRGGPVTFVGYNRYSAGGRATAAFVRKDGESSARVINAAKLGRSRAESLERQTSIPAM